MLFTTSIISLSLIIISSFVNNLVINFIGYTAGAPMYGMGGNVIAYNQSTGDGINMTFFNEIWQYPTKWCEMQHYYINIPDVIVDVGPVYSEPPCTYDVTRFANNKRFQNYQTLDRIAITLSVIEFLGTIIFDIRTRLNSVNFKHIIIRNIYLISVALQLIAIIIMIYNISYLDTLGVSTWLLKMISVKDNIDHIYICLICMMVISIFVNAIHKCIYIVKKSKEAYEENHTLIN